MGCCGGQSGKLAKAGSIVKGYTSYGLHKIFHVEGELYKGAKKRQAICQSCEFQTWLKKAEYLKWLTANGIDIAKEFTDLTRLPMLDKHDFEPGRSLFCRLCKCWIPAKAYSKDEQCPKDKWAD